MDTTKLYLGSRAAQKTVRPKEYDFLVNYNKPNYYVAFLNGLAEDPESWATLNHTHLEIAKERLEWFSAILILEQPEAHQLLQKWLPHTTTLLHKNANNNPNNSNNTKYNDDDTRNNKTIAMSREEFDQLNSLDRELYEYAIQLSHSILRSF